MKRNPTGGAYVDAPGGYLEDAGATFGAGTHPHRHAFILNVPIDPDDKPLFKDPLERRCRYCYMTRAEAKEGR